MIIKKIFDYVKEHNMLNAGDYVVAGVSGGADSVCLLFALLEIRKKLPIDIHVVHVNHMIRDGAKDDAEYVRSLCEKFDIKFTLKECDVAAAAKREGISVEEAGRNARYKAFYEVLYDAGARGLCGADDECGKIAEDGKNARIGKNAKTGKIAVAHNKNDCCETFLFNLFRGSSLRGLSGIAPARGKVIRPLMCLERSEIEEFLDKNGIKYCIDHTNLEDNYTRNRIRHHILDTAVEMISPAAIAHISDACVKISGAYSFISDITADAYKRCVKEDEKGVRIDSKEYDVTHHVIQGYVIMAAIEKAAQSAKNIESAHVEQIRALFKKQCGRKVDLPYKLCAVRDYSGVLLQKACGESADNIPIEYALTASDRERLLNNESIEIDLRGGESLVLSIIEADSKNIKNIPQKKYTKWLDYDRIEKDVVIRTRKEGDYLTIDAPEGAIRRKTLKSYFTDKKIPVAERGKICLVTEGSHVLWITGDRISCFYKISGSTKRILELKLKN